MPAPDSLCFNDGSHCLRQPGEGALVVLGAAKQPGEVDTLLVPHLLAASHTPPSQAVLLCQLWLQFLQHALSPHCLCKVTPIGSRRKGSSLGKQEEHGRGAGVTTVFLRTSSSNP